MRKADKTARARQGQTRPVARAVDRVQIDAAINLAHPVYCAINGRSRPEAEERELREKLHRLLLDVPLNHNSLEQTARHEASHLIAGAFFGFAQHCAVIRRTSRAGQLHDWSGGTLASYFYPKQESILHCPAVVALAGPIATGGGFRSGLADYVISADILRQVDDASVKRNAIVRKCLNVATRIVGTFETEICAVARLLRHRRRVEVVDFDVAQILARVSDGRNYLEPPSRCDTTLVERIVPLLEGIIG